MTALQPRWAHSTVWALPRSLAATSGISVDFYSFGYWDVSVPRVRPIHLCIQWIVHDLSSHAGFPIRKSPDQKMFALPRGLSQLATSFITSQSQGIRPVPLLLDFNSQDFVNPWRLSQMILSHQNLWFYFLRDKKISSKNQILWLLLENSSTQYKAYSMVEDSGVAPLTSCLQSRRSTSWANPPFNKI